MVLEDCVEGTATGRGYCLGEHRVALEFFWWGPTYALYDCLGKRKSHLGLMVKIFVRRQKRAERAAAQKRKEIWNPLLPKNHSLNASAITNYHILRSFFEKLFWPQAPKEVTDFGWNSRPGLRRSEIECFGRRLRSAGRPAARSFWNPLLPKNHSLNASAITNYHILRSFFEKLFWPQAP